MNEIKSLDSHEIMCVVGYIKTLAICISIVNIVCLCVKWDLMKTYLFCSTPYELLIMQLRELSRAWLPTQALVFPCGGEKVTLYS